MKNKLKSLIVGLFIAAVALNGISIATEPTVSLLNLSAHAATLNPIQIENSYPGDPDWDQFAANPNQDVLSGYASQTSVNHGKPIDFYVTTIAPSLSIDIYRTGWYGGAGARKMASLGNFVGQRQSIPKPDPKTGIIESHWNKTTTLNVPANWTTGTYLARLNDSLGDSSFIFFVVRNDGGNEEFVFQTSVTTYQAYNEWGGISLYNNITDKSVYPNDMATKVSFDRPFDPKDGNGSGHYLWFEYPFVRWAESQGYNLTYITDIDTQTNINPLTNHKAFLSGGHDEYWSKGMRDNVQNAINRGVNVAFFSANIMFWQIRLEPNSLGVSNRTEVAYKNYADPMFGVDNSIVTVNWRDPLINRPENALIGIMYLDQIVDSNPAGFAYVIKNASHWVYAGTGFVDGSSVPGIVGYEFDAVWNNGFTPPGITILSNSPVVGCCEGTGNTFSNSTIYTASSGARIFASGTMEWSWALDDYYQPGLVNSGIQKTTSNILNDFSK